jgi:hypothetical protein
VAPELQSQFMDLIIGEGEILVAMPRLMNHSSTMACLIKMRLFFRYQGTDVSIRCLESSSRRTNQREDGE